MDANTHIKPALRITDTILSAIEFNLGVFDVSDNHTLSLDSHLPNTTIDSFISIQPTSHFFWHSFGMDVNVPHSTFVSIHLVPSMSNE